MNTEEKPSHPILYVAEMGLYLLWCFAAFPSLFKPSTPLLLKDSEPASPYRALRIKSTARWMDVNVKKLYLIQQSEKRKCLKAKKGKKKASRANRPWVTESVWLLFHIAIYLFSTANMLEPYRWKISLPVLFCAVRSSRTINCQQEKKEESIGAGGRTSPAPTNRKKASNPLCCFRKCTCLLVFIHMVLRFELSFERPLKT